MARESLPHSYTSPDIHSWIFKTLWVIIFWVWVLTHPTPPLHDPPHPTPPHPYMTHPTPPHPTPPHPFMTHPPTPPHPWYIFGHKGAFFHGLLHYVSLSVDNELIIVTWISFYKCIIAVCKDSCVACACGFDRNGKWEWFCKSKWRCKKLLQNDVAKMTS